MVNGTSSAFRMIWAIDPFAPQGVIQRASARAIQGITQKLPASIEPVYVGSDPRHQIPPKLRNQYNREVAALAQAEIDSWKVPFSGLLPVRVLGPTGSSIREQVDCLLKYAESESADLIVASTRARRALHRLFFGSFVETLSLICDLPLLVVNPSWKAPSSKNAHPFERILFPTDFTDESHDAFVQLLPFAKRMKSEITLFHKISMGLAMLPEAAAITMTISEEARQAELDVSRINAESWAREAKRAGVTADAIVDFREGESIAASILKEGSKRNCMIAMAGSSNRLENRLLGSVTRHILRESPNPVWVIRPPQSVEEWQRRRAA